MPTRRTFLIAGTLGGILLVGTCWTGFRSRSAVEPLPEHRFAEGDPARAMMAAVAGAMLAGALPSEAPARDRALAHTLTGLDVAIAGLPAATQRELDRLFGVLTFPPTRFALAGVTSHWQDASPLAVEALLQRLRSSPIALLRAAYDALHQLVFAAWYGQPQAWTALRYSGPPRLA